MFRIVNNKLFDSSLLQCPPAVPAAGVRIPRRDMSVPGALAEDGDDLGPVQSLLSIVALSLSQLGHISYKKSSESFKVV
jgi:hypothetical protein